MKRRIFIPVIIAVVVVGAIILIGRGDSSNTHTSTNGTYIAYGDSVAAGIGLQDYRDASACDRTNASYPVLVAKQLSYSLNDAACSGATVANGLLGSQTVNQLALPPQIMATKTKMQPKLVTVTIGANDAGWLDALKTCYTADCSSTDQQAAFAASLAQAKRQVVSALAAIQKQYPAPTKLVLTSYYSIYPTTEVASCAELSGITADELRYIDQTQNDMTTMLQAAAQQVTGTRFAAVNFSGHELCSKDPWVQGLSDGAPFHPTAAGQQKIAQAVRSVL